MITANYNRMVFLNIHICDGSYELFVDSGTKLLVQIDITSFNKTNWNILIYPLARSNTSLLLQYPKVWLVQWDHVYIDTSRRWNNYRGVMVLYQHSNFHAVQEDKSVVHSHGGMTSRSECISLRYEPSLLPYMPPVILKPTGDR